MSDFVDIPILKLELEGIRKRVYMSLMGSDSAFRKMLQESIEEQLTEEWVKDRINMNVKEMLTAAIDGITNNYELKYAIQDIVAKSVTKLITTGADKTPGENNE